MERMVMEHQEHSRCRNHYNEVLALEVVETMPMVGVWLFKVDPEFHSECSIVVTSGQSEDMISRAGTCWSACFLEAKYIESTSVVECSWFSLHVLQADNKVSERWHCNSSG